MNKKVNVEMTLEESLEWSKFKSVPRLDRYGDAISLSAKICYMSFCSAVPVMSKQQRKIFNYIIAIDRYKNENIVTTKLIELINMKESIYRSVLIDYDV